MAKITNFSNYNLIGEFLKKIVLPMQCTYYLILLHNWQLLSKNLKQDQVLDCVQIYVQGFPYACTCVWGGGLEAFLIK